MASAGGWLLGIALFFPFFALGGLGGGDVKLLGALGAWLGPTAVFHVGLYSAIAGGVMASLVAFRAGYLDPGVPQSIGFSHVLDDRRSSAGRRPDARRTRTGPGSPMPFPY